MKAHIGVDSKNKLIHSMVATPANVHDKHAISSQKKLIAQAAPKVCDFTN